MYSWKLVPSDKTPPGKREGLSLREKEMQIIADMAAGIVMPKKITVSEVAHSVFYAPAYVAMTEGYFEEEGLKYK